MTSWEFVKSEDEKVEEKEEENEKERTERREEDELEPLTCKKTLKLVTHSIFRLLF